MLECGDCFYLHTDNITGKWKCKKHFGTFEVDSPACSDFLSEETHDCCDCTYCEPTTFSFKCTLTGKKLSSPSSTPACSRFVED